MASFICGQVMSLGEVAFAFFVVNTFVKQEIFADYDGTAGGVRH